MMGGKNTVEVKVQLLYQTGMSALVHDGTVKTWLPLSQIEIVRSDDRKHHIVTMPEWLAIDKGLC